MITVRSLTAADVALGMRLKAAAGWNQTEADWRRLLELDPEGCLVAEFDGAAAATATVTLFGDVAWAAMVLTDPAYRGRGLATALLRRGLDWAHERGATAVRLDATSLGRPVYERLGFRVVGEERRYIGTPVVTVPSADPFVGSSASLERQLAAAAEVDRAATGNDRAKLLSTMQRDWPEQFDVVVSGNRSNGYALARRGSRCPQFGPCIATSPELGAALVRRGLLRLGGGPVYVDVPSANRPACELFEQCGLIVERTFFRMTLGRDVPEREADIWANFGPELG